MRLPSLPLGVHLIGARVEAFLACRNQARICLIFAQRGGLSDAQRRAALRDARIEGRRARAAWGALCDC